MASKVEQHIGPVDLDVMRAIFLYVGQGESTLFFMPNNGNGHKTVLVDSNVDIANGGIDLVELLLDVLPASANTKDKRPVLDYYLNTHPHKDHAAALKEIRESVRVVNVWHSGHYPGPDDGTYQNLQDLIKEVENAKGEVVTLEGSRTSKFIGQTEIYVLSPAKYVCDDIEGQDEDTRKRRIHEQCAVLNFRYGSDSLKAGILITGDSDKTAWKDHIRYYHEAGKANRVQADILSASHHGSYTFFKDREDDEEPYEEHLKAIDPTHIVISAPDRKDSKHNHPHKETLERYQDYVGNINVHHMSSKGNSIVVDVYPDGTYDLRSDDGKLAAEFHHGKSDKQEERVKETVTSAAVITSRVEVSKPMG